ncbi:MAG: glycine cleavage system aminomethyltransferase GcvT, partial [Thalassobaculaceae bacterium]
LLVTPLHGLHRELSARMAPFAGYDMPVQYADGVIAEHLHTRAEAGLFDVSHMGQIRLYGADRAARLETLVTGDIQGLAVGQTRYTLLTNDAGGILDDILVTCYSDHLFVVVNGARKAEDSARLAAIFGADFEARGDDALIALQGPAAAGVVTRLAPAAGDLVFMTGAAMPIAGVEAVITRAGYTGEDGFEIAVAGGAAPGLAKLLLEDPAVRPIGLGARDTLRLEAGLCLYGQDIDATTSPVEAALTWAVPKTRRADGRFPGADVINRQLADGVTRKRVGLRPDGRAPVRAGAPLTDADGHAIGQVTSGGFGPTVGGPVAMGYVTTEHAAVGHQVFAHVRGKALPCRVSALPFVPQNYFRGPAATR